MIVTKAINSPLAFTVVGLIDPLFKITIDTTLGNGLESFVLPMNNDIGHSVANMVVDWGDGTTDTITTWNQAELNHDYSLTTGAGVYTISLDGVFSGIKFNNGGDKLKLTEINQWGTNQWTTMNAAFRGCLNMIGTYTDTPDTSLVVTMARMFETCYLFNSAVNFDTVNVTSIYYMFSYCYQFNQPINFNAPALVSSQYAFHQCTVLNQPINITTTSALSATTRMFYNCKKLTGPITISDTSGVGSMDYMFWTCTDLNTPINFNSSSCTNFNNLFTNCINLNSSITLDTSSALNVGALFNGCSSFNQPVSFTTPLVTSFAYMFYNCSSMASAISLSTTSSATSFSHMFRGCTLLDIDVSSYDISNVTTAVNMFLSSAFSTSNYNSLLPLWDAYGTSNVPFHAGTAQYEAGAPAIAHAAMLGRSWSITDGGPV